MDVSTLVRIPLKFSRVHLGLNDFLGLYLLAEDNQTHLKELSITNQIE